MKAKRLAFIEAQPTLDIQRLVFVDESGFRLDSPPRYGWAPRGKASPGKAVHGKWTTMTMIGAIALDGFRGLMTIDAGTGNDVFRAFVEHELVPNLKRDDIVVLDNLSSHRDKVAIELIHDVGADVLHTPPYSPEFNAIEKTWSKMKEFLRRAETSTRDLFDKAVAGAMDTITRSDIAGWIRHAGYR